MKIFSKIKNKILYKLILGFIFVSLFVGVVNYIGINTINDIEYSYGEISTKYLHLIQNLGEMKFACLRLINSASEYGYIRTENMNMSKPDPLEREEVQFNQTCNSCHTALAQYEIIAKKSFPEAFEHTKEIRKGGSILHIAAIEFVEMKKNGILGNKALKKNEEMEVGEKAFLEAVTKTIQHINDKLETEKSQLTSAISSSFKKILIFSWLTFLFSVLIGILMSRSITNPITKLTQMTNEFRKGNLDATIDIKSTDEIGTLAHSFNKMAANLKDSTTQLQIEKLRFQELYENSPIGIVLLTKDNEIIQINRAFQEIFQYSNEEAKGMNIDKLVVPSERAEEGINLTKVALQSGIADKETVRKRKDGRLIHTHVYGVPVIMNGEVEGQYALYEDISVRKKSEEELRFQNEIMTNMTEAFYLVRLEDNVIVYANSNFERMFGYEKNELLGKHVSIINAPTAQSPEEIAEEIRDSIIKNKFWNGEVNNIKKNGASFWCYANVSVFDHSVFGKVFISFHTDINERKEAEKLQAAVYRITKISDVSPTIDDLFKNVHNIIKEVMLADNFYIALYDEKENLISTPYYVDEVDPLEAPRKPGKGLTEYVIFDSKSVLCDEKLFQEMLARGEVESIGSPSPIWLGVPLIVNNKTIGMMAAQHYSDATVYGRRELEIFEFVSSEIANAIEKRIAAEQELKLMQELESTNKELNDFAYIVSHDLKAPLRAMGSLTNWLTNDYADKFDDQGKEMMNLLVGRVKRMHDLIEGVLRYSRGGRIKEDFVELSLNSEVKEIIELLSPPVNIEIRIENDLPTIIAEPTRIRQVFQNLISNAIKYIDKPKGLIRIGCERNNGDWKFYVGDNGPGIDKKHHEKIFQIFQTLASRDELESTGIGLTIGRKILEMNGGKIWIESEIGLGSTFFFTLPVRDI